MGGPGFATSTGLSSTGNICLHSTIIPCFAANFTTLGVVREDRGEKIPLGLETPAFGKVHGSTPAGNAFVMRRRSSSSARRSSS
jgi:hypothetical protein